MKSRYRTSKRERRSTEVLIVHSANITRLMRPKSVSLFEWLADHCTDLEKTDQDEADLFIMIDEYINLLDAFENADSKSGEHDARLLKEKKKAIMKLVSRNRRKSSSKN